MNHDVCATENVSGLFGAARIFEQKPLLAEKADFLT